jgi:predicted RNase H-like HicB family nuclease
MKTTLSQVRKFAKRYPKVIEWSDEDRCFVGSAPPLVGQCCHGVTEAVVLGRLQAIVEEWVATSLAEGKPLPTARAKGSMSADELSALIETAELLADPAARRAVADAEAGGGKVYTLDAL